MKESKILSVVNKSRSVTNLDSKNVLTGFFFSRQTYYLVFLWVLTWYSYWIFMKNQVTTINIIGAVISGGLLVFSRFWPVRDLASKASRFLSSKISKKTQLTPESLDSEDQTEVEPPSMTCRPRVETSSICQVEESPEQTPVVETQELEPESMYLASKPFGQTTAVNTEKLEPESIDLAENSQQMASESNGCPKNLAYYTQKPRPKQTPEECMTCKNLIACVCLTSG